MTPPTFDGFGEKALPFLTALGFHQTREWFHENKPLYQSEVKAPLDALVETVSARLAAEGVPLKGSPKASTFRVNRDVRFSKAKHPYNTHASAVLTPTGTKKDATGLYVHVTPGDTFLAAGLWHPSSEGLKALREAIVKDPGPLLKIEAGLAKHGLAFETDAMLSRGPAGFPKQEGERARLLRHKTFVVRRDLGDALVPTPAIADEWVRLAHEAMPLLRFVWRFTDPDRAR